MAQTKSKSPSPLLTDACGLSFVFIGLFTFLSLGSFSATDPSFFSSASGPAKNWAGTFGSHWAAALWQVFGAGGYALGFLFLLGAVACFRRVERKAWALASINYLLLLISVVACLGLIEGKIRAGGTQFPLGGWLGSFMASTFARGLNTWGAGLLSFCLLVLALSLSFKVSVRDLCLHFWWALSQLAIRSLALGLFASMKIWDFLSEAYGEVRPLIFNGLRSLSNSLRELGGAALDHWQKNTIEEKALVVGGPVIVSGGTSEKETLAATPPLASLITEANNDPEIVWGQKDESRPDFDAPPEMGNSKTTGAGLSGLLRRAARESDRAVKTALGKQIRFELPSLSFLNTPVASERAREENDELIRLSRLVEEKLTDFHVKGQVTAVKPGPVVTMFEFKPASGVKVNAISNLADDLALALSATSIRIVAPIPGRDVVGIEVPNRKRQSVLLKEILGADSFLSKNHAIPIAIGKDILGAPVVADLKKMPHLLVAGTTGSGKSVFINSLICSLLYRFSPTELKLVLVDPKQLELAPYNDIPHLLLPVVTEPKKASLALQWAVQEMERRYRVIAASVTRDLEGFNKKLAELGPEGMREILNKFDSVLGLQTPEPMPKLVIVIDELADLMMTAKADVENNICRLAQKARAAGIHLVLATQRPSTDVITGLIKANLPTRICFKVSSKVDSRVMFDAMGAEKLIGQGDMLFMPPGDSSLVRLHGAYLSVEEVDQITTFWRQQGSPEYREDILVDPEEMDEEMGFSEAEANDPLYQQALDVAYSSGSISASYLQRRLRIGYNKAARFVELMESQGIVGPSDGSKPRPLIGPRP
jgi:hypothetical protein